VDSPKNEPSVHKAADKLAAEIRAGASFEAIAAQFSSSATGTRPADPFWVELSQLDPAVAAALSKTAKGGVTAPVKTESGYQLVKLFNTRAKAGSEPETVAAVEPIKPRAELAFKQIIISPKPEHAPSKKAFVEAAKTVAGAPGKCSENTVPANIDLNNFALKASLIRRTSNDLPEQVRAALDNLKVGTVSETVTTPQDVRIYMLCERVELPPEPQDGTVQTASNESLRQALYEEKLDLEAQKYMRNLRREAFVEIRGF
jgi:peptidyl-prolyl cis-trans isomerase SurA